MTVIVGERSFRTLDVAEPNVSIGIRTDASWDERLQRHYARARELDTWQPHPASPRARTRSLRSSEPELARPGLMCLYATRMAHARVDTTVIRRSSCEDRLLVGDYEENGTRRRCLALVSTSQLGRSTVSHYQTLYPGFRSVLGSWLPNGHNILRDAQQKVRDGAEGVMSLPGIFVDGVRVVWGVGTSAHGLTRTGASRRALIAVLAAFLVVASFARSGRAEDAPATAGHQPTMETNDVAVGRAMDDQEDPGVVLVGLTVGQSYGETPNQRQLRVR